MSFSLLVAACAISACALAVYEARHVEISVRLRPASYGGYRNGLKLEAFTLDQEKAKEAQLGSVAAGRL